MIKCLLLIISLFVFNSNTDVYAISLQDEFSQLKHEDSLDIYVIALYSSQVRENIYNVSMYPEGLVKINDNQKKSYESFKELISSYTKEDQQKIWNLSRYKDLMTDLLNAGGKRKKIDKALQKYPTEMHDDANFIANNHELLKSIVDVQSKFDKEFEKIIAAYSPEIQHAFRELLNSPEALSLLNRNMNLTVRIGSMYKDSSTELRQQFDSLNLIVAEQNAHEKEEWSKELNENPDAQKEMKQSADKFAEDNNYRKSEIAITDPVIIEHYVYVPYSYWSGYPWWYEYDYWYPYPYWYHCGFYVWNDRVVWIRPPSWYFIRWHFNHHHHLFEYPHLTNVYINHYYYGPRRGISGNTLEVSSWMKQNEMNLPRDFKSATEQRIVRIREFSKSEMDREEINKKNPNSNITREDFMKQHAEEYPTLKEHPVIEEPRNKITEPVESKDKKVLPTIEEKRNIPEQKTKSMPPVKENGKEATPQIPDQRKITPPSKQQTVPNKTSVPPKKPEAPQKVQPVLKERKK